MLLEIIAMEVPPYMKAQPTPALQTEYNGYLTVVSLQWLKISGTSNSKQSLYLQTTNGVIS